MHWHEQVLPGWEGIPATPGESSGSTQAFQQRLCSFPVASLLMKHRHAPSSKPATDASARSHCLAGTTVEGSFLPNTHMSHQDLSLCCASWREGDVPQNLLGNCSLCDALPRFS